MCYYHVFINIRGKAQVPYWYSDESKLSPRKQPPVTQLFPDFNFAR